jgi:hypothetical protein
LPVDDPPAEDGRGVVAEEWAPPCGVVVEAEPPALDEEVLVEVFSVVVGEAEAASDDDCGDEPLRIRNVAQQIPGCGARARARTVPTPVPTSAQKKRD